MIFKEHNILIQFVHTTKHFKILKKSGELIMKEKKKNLR